MSKSDKFKQYVVLFSFFLSLIVSFVAAGAVIGLFWSEKQDQERQHASQPPLLLPLAAEPNRLDFHGIGKGEKEIHEGIVHLVNQSGRKIVLLFTKSSCTCSAAELPGKVILPGEKLPMKCLLSTAGRISDRAGGEIWVAYRFSDSAEEDVSPMYVRLILTAVVSADPIP